MNPWYDLYWPARRLLRPLTDDERRRCLIRHARRCVAGCSYIEYDPDEVDVQVEWTCLLGASVADALSELRSGPSLCAHCGCDAVEVQLVGRGPLLLCRRCETRHREVLQARGLIEPLTVQDLERYRAELGGEP